MKKESSSNSDKTSRNIIHKQKLYLYSVLSQNILNCYLQQTNKLPVIIHHIFGCIV